ncbi:MAG: gamma-glutamylcyclotransferase [Burkholderiaceae bacterium]
MSSTYSSLHVRDPQPMLDEAMQAWGGESDLWVFAYASLIWRPEFDADEQRPGVVHGWHRALEMRSRVNRGTPEVPGLVFALVPGGSCRGIVYRIGRDRAAAELERLWVREMPTGVYDPKWLTCRTPQGRIQALSFTLHRTSPARTGTLSDPEMLDVLRRAVGRFGSTLDYLIETDTSLRACGIRDRDVQRLVALARQHRLA